MSQIETSRRRMILREVEGYLDLLQLFGEQWVPVPAQRTALAERAIGTLNKLSEEERLSPPAQNLLGQAYRSLERYAEAIPPLRIAADAEPKNIHIWLALGWCYKRTSRLDLAIESLEEALEAKPNVAIIHYNLACYWSLAQHKEHALKYLANALQIDPDYRDLVAQERDFDPLRNDPDFRALTAVLV
ncbi:MAG: tetratricopeptide repeat protein [Pirellulales bacterium]|nr:tetratricopeptide repeat protein [Pirellulales bacterium]